MRVVVTGAGGQLGREVVRAWSSAGEQVVALDRAALDIGEDQDVWAAVRDYAPDVVVNAAAYTKVDACEDDPAPAWAINAGGAASLARACRAAGALLVHVSTDYVFDGAAPHPYTEFDRPNPQSVYGRTKDAGEQLVRQHCPEHQIVRTAWLHGAGGANFVTTMLRFGRERGAATVVTDQAGSPTFAFDLAPAMRQLAVTRRPGTFHLVNSGFATWYEVAEATFAEAGLDVELTPTDSAAFARPAPRPANSRLECRHAELAGLGPLPHWRQSLGRFVEEVSG